MDTDLEILTCNTLEMYSTRSEEKVLNGQI